MIYSQSHLITPRSVAIIGNYLPRKCGIATFTSDLLTSLQSKDTDIAYWAVAMNDKPDGYHYPSEVRFELYDRMIPEYHLAAEFLNTSKVEAVILQHEYGIFGGDWGSHILELIGNLEMPVITTLHTVLAEPTAQQMKVVKLIAQASDRLVVLSHRAKKILQEVYGVSPPKALMIPHGIPDMPLIDSNYYKDKFGVEGRKVMLTFGLLSPGKGIEDMIEALPAVVKNHPNAVYVVLGATHPNILKEFGETYRISLQRRAAKLGVGDNILFFNRFVDLPELCEFIGAADIYVTPYLNKDQIVSGTLAYALGAGKATVSTPYWYAQEMLAEGRGRLVPFADPKALSFEVNDLLENEVECDAMRKRAHTFCREMIWKEVARKYSRAIADAIDEKESIPKVGFGIKFIRDDIRESRPPQLDHLLRMTDDVGILQHAKLMVADRQHGYCTDDNARALIAILLGQEFVDDTNLITKLVCTYLSFLQHAFNEQNGRFRNFMGYDRSWLDDEGSEDSHGRAIWSLGTTISLARSPHLRGVALPIFEKALPSLEGFTSVRGLAFALIGICTYLRKFSGDTRAKRLTEELSGKLYQKYQDNFTDDWLWIEDTVTYSNGNVAQALIASGQVLKKKEIVDAGLQSLEWLIKGQIDPKGHFSPIGNHDWHSKLGKRARFDQQPVEAQSIIEACYEAYKVTREAKWVSYAQCCFEWFLGENDLRTLMYDYDTGGCYDGLSANGPNRNQGAESTLAWIISLFNFNQLRSLQISDEAEGEKKDTEATYIEKYG